MVSYSKDREIKGIAYNDRVSKERLHPAGNMAEVVDEAGQERRAKHERQRDLKEALTKVLANLSDQDREIIQRAYGIDRAAETQIQIGKSLGITQTAVSHRIERILNSLRKHRGQLRAFYEPYF